jgi:hypothetical protein
LRTPGASRPAPAATTRRRSASGRAKYEARTRGEIDSARLPDLILGLQKEGLQKDLRTTTLPKLLVAYAFDIVPPQTKALLESFTLAHCAPERGAGRAVKLTFRSAREELERAAAWARARLEEGASRIGVVVPDLAKRRKEAAAGVLARHAAGLQPARRAEKRDAVQRLARRAARRGASGSLRAEPHPVLIRGTRLRQRQPPGALAVPRRRRD